MELHRAKRKFIRLIRLYPLLALGALAIAYLLGGFSQTPNPPVPRSIVIGVLYGFMGVIPLVVILIFIGIGMAEDKARDRNLKNLNKLSEEDPFDLAYEKMCGFKVVALTGQEPTFTGITGDTYKKDDSSACKAFPEHVPPVSDCECGFYTFKDRRDAEFELSISPGLFLIQVDLFGIGFAHKRGYRAESQRVNSLILPKRCMNCKILPSRAFIKSYKIGYGVSAWWQWSARCSLCASKVKSSDKLTIEEMGQQLQVSIS